MISQQGMVTTALKTPQAPDHAAQSKNYGFIQLHQSYQQSTAHLHQAQTGCTAILQWHWCGFFCLYQKCPILTPCCLHILVFLFSHHPPANILWLKKRFKNPTEHTKALRAAAQKLGWRGKPFPSEGISHQLAAAFPSPVPPAGRLCGPIHHSFHSLSISQLWAKADFSQEGVGWKIRCMSFFRKRNPNDILSPSEQPTPFAQQLCLHAGLKAATFFSWSTQNRPRRVGNPALTQLEMNFQSGFKENSHQNKVKLIFFPLFQPYGREKEGESQHGHHSLRQTFSKSPCQVPLSCWLSVEIPIQFQLK